MTPKEKAIELYIKYKQLTTYVDLLYNSDTLDKFHYNAKDAALIAVKEIMNTLDKHLDANQFQVMNYFQEVKQEIEAL